MQEGQIKGIYICSKSGKQMESVQSIEALEGKGLKGDRYADKSGTFSKGSKPREVTFIEIEALESVNRDYDIKIKPEVTRRNILTQGVALNHLVHKKFKVGDLLFEGTELCEPCGYLEDKAKIKKLKKALRHRGGIRAKVLTGGILSTNDIIRID